MLTRLSPLVLNALSLVLLAATAVGADPAPDARTILILGSTITGGQNSPEAVQARLLGFTVEVATDTQWYAKSTADFRSYRAIVFGDPSCPVDTAPLAAAEDTLDVWGPAVSGNVLIVGTDPTFHHNAGTAGGAKLMAAGLTFAAGGPTTGAFIGLSCYYAFASEGTPVPVLAPFGAFQVVGQGGDCLNAVHVLPHRALAGVTDGDLSNWGCSVHEAFTAWPSFFTPAAIALEMPSPFVAPDGSSGAPYILAREGSVQALTKYLIATVRSLHVQSLAAQLQGIAAKAERSDKRAACGQLKAFTNHVAAQSGKKVPPAVAAALTESARTIGRMLSCR